jgi:membrane protein
VSAGPEIAEAVARRVGLGWTSVATGNVPQGPLVFALVATGTGLVYCFAPDAEHDWVWITPGSILATLLWLIASLGFR